MLYGRMGDVEDGRTVSRRRNGGSDTVLSAKVLNSSGFGAGGLTCNALTLRLEASSSFLDASSASSAA